MPIIDLYSKRKKRAEKGNQPEVYQYEELPLAFRRQVIHIWRTAIAVLGESQNRKHFEDVQTLPGESLSFN